MACANRLVLGVLLVLATLAMLLASLVSGWSASLLDQISQPGEDLALLHTQEQTRAERIRAKLALLDQLEEGEITLYEAAAQFRILNAASPQLILPDCLVKSSNSPEERLCREVLVFMEAQTRYRPELQNMAARLKQQLEDDLSENGIVLPEV